MAAVAAGAAAALLGAAPKPRTPNVLLVTIDTLRPDALGWISGANETPSLDAMARTGFAFPRAVSPAPLTLPAHASLFSGLLPRRHGARENGRVLPGGVRTLPQLLKARGYATAAFVSGFPLRAMFGLDRGFDRYDDTLPQGQEGWTERSAGDTTAAALAWLRGAKGPWLLWVHYYDPHYPYEPPRAYWRPGRRGAYDGEVAYVDHELGRLREAAAARGEPTLTVVAGDHGEALGEHGETSHGYYIYDSTVLVPLQLELPGTIVPGRSDAPARLVDVTPTVLELLGVRIPAGLDGVSLLPALAGRTQEIPPAYLECRTSWLGFGWAPLKGIRTAEWKLVVAPRPELYSLKRDPREEANALGAERDVARALAARLRAIESVPEATGGTATDPELQAKLRSLGYLGGGSAEKEPPAGLPDPKDRIALKEAMTTGDALLREGDARAALAKFEAALASEPSCRYASFRAGVACLKLGRADDAIRHLERAVSMRGDEPEYRFALGDALMRKGRTADAAAQWMEVVRLQPRSAPAWANLAISLRDLGKLAQSESAYVEAARLEPADPALKGGLAEVRYRLAALKLRGGDRAGAARTLAAAISAEPKLEARAASDPAFAALRP